LSRRAAFEDEQHVAVGDIESAEMVVASHNFKAEQALIEGDCDFEVARVQTGFEDSGDLH
jgi:predicted phosphodiesterase